MNKWKELEQEVKNTDIPSPLFYGDFLGLSLFIWKKPELRAECCETSPYEPDGSVELVFIQVAWFELMFYNRTLYNILYKRKYGYLPEVSSGKSC